ncbi:hypothetical protein P3S68_015806 [Capsicum galapagoense]
MLSPDAVRSVPNEDFFNLLEDSMSYYALRSDLSLQDGYNLDSKRRQKQNNKQPGETFVPSTFRGRFQEAFSIHFRFQEVSSWSLVYSNLPPEINVWSVITIVLRTLTRIIETACIIYLFHNGLNLLG